MRTLTFEPLISPTLWITLAIALAAMLAWYGWRRPAILSRIRWIGIITLMATAAGLLLVILLNPTWVEPIPAPPGKPLLTLLVDSSTSMATADAQQGQSRYQAAGNVAGDMANALQKQFDIQIRTFSEAVKPSDAAELANHAPAGQATDLAAAINAGIAQDRPQGQALVLLSDGIQTAPGGVTPVLQAVQMARAMSAPVYTQTFGGQAGRWDVAVELRTPQQLAYVGQKVPITAMVTHQGLAGKRVGVELLHEGQSIDKQETLLQDTGPSEVRLLVKEESPGLHRYEVRVDPVAGEITPLNNTAPLLLNVVKEPIRVLLLEGKPYWDLKFLVRTLSADPAVALDSVVRLTGSRFLRRTLNTADTQPAASRPVVRPSTAVRRPGAAAAGSQPADSWQGTAAAGTQPADRPRLEQWKIITDSASVLTDAAQLRSYQMVVLGRDAEAFLTDSAVANLKQWIARDGGSLVCYRGSPAVQVNEQLARLLPVRWTPRREAPFHVKLTSQGQDLHWLYQGASETEAGHGLSEAEGGVLAQLPSLSRAADVTQHSPLAVVLATASGAGDAGESPVVCYQTYGTGRVVVVEGAGMWRWAFLAPQYQQLDYVYSTLWQSLLRWLVSTVTLLPGQDLSLQADRLTFNTNEPATAMLAMREGQAGKDIPRVELRGDALPEPKLHTPAPVGDPPDAFRVIFGKLPEGRYEAQVAGRDKHDTTGRTTFDVRTPLREQLDLQARPDIMARIAEDSGGAVLTSGSADELAKRFTEHMARAQPPRVRRTPAWDRLWALVAVLGVWATAWGVRRSAGLI